MELRLHTVFAAHLSRYRYEGEVMEMSWTKRNARRKTRRIAGEHQIAVSLGHLEKLPDVWSEWFPGFNTGYVLYITDIINYSAYSTSLCRCIVN